MSDLSFRVVNTDSKFFLSDSPFRVVYTDSGVTEHFVEEMLNGSEFLVDNKNSASKKI